MTTNERVAYFNGQIIPESQACISIRDTGFTYGNGVFDAARTFNGQIFKLTEHVNRLFHSLKYVDLDIGLSPDEVIQLTLEVTEQNLPLLGPNEDYWVFHRVSGGPNDPLAAMTSPTVVIECTPLPLKARAPLYRDGMDVAFPSVRRIPPECLSPNVKSSNYLNLTIAHNEVQEHSPGAWAILLDIRGFICEGLGSNPFLVRNGKIYTPKGQYVLEGISRQTVIELAHKLKIPVVEDDITPFDAYRADEAFITSTSLCVCPVGSFSKKPLQDEAIPGPITQKLTEAFSQLVDCDFVGQYLAQLG